MRYTLRVMGRLTRTMLLSAVGAMFLWVAAYSYKTGPHHVGTVIGAALVGGFGAIVLYVEAVHLRMWFSSRASRVGRVDRISRD